MVETTNRLRRRLKGKLRERKAGLRIMVLPVAWRADLHLHVDSLRDRESTEPMLLERYLSAITLSTIPTVRNIISDILLDSMYCSNC